MSTSWRAYENVLGNNRCIYQIFSFPIYGIWAAHHIIWICQKLCRLVDSLKTCIIITRRYSHADRKMEKSRAFEWTIPWIKMSKMGRNLVFKRQYSDPRWKQFFQFVSLFKKEQFYIWIFYRSNMFILYYNNIKALF